MDNDDNNIIANIPIYNNAWISYGIIKYLTHSRIIFGKCTVESVRIELETLDIFLFLLQFDEAYTLVNFFYCIFLNSQIYYYYITSLNPKIRPSLLAIIDKFSVIFHFNISDITANKCRYSRKFHIISRIDFNIYTFFK